MRVVRVRTSSAAQTRALGTALARVARAGDRIALIGPLGAGKTQLVKGFAAGLGIGDEVTSPSFILMAEYAGRLPLFHVDLFRLAGTEEALEGGVLDEREEAGVTITEWADRLDARLDPDRLEIRLVAGPDDDRELVLGAPGRSRYARYLAVAAAWARSDARGTGR
jgi:tRNA threonylcarbamoyladenosine biosynthesis protein TsaE